MNTIDNIPPEILQNIFGWVPHPINIRLVCQLWASLLPIKQLFVTLDDYTSATDKYLVDNFNFGQDNNNINFKLYKGLKCDNCGGYHFTEPINVNNLPNNNNNTQTVLLELYVIANQHYTFNINDSKFNVYIINSSQQKAVQFNSISIMWRDIDDNNNIIINNPNVIIKKNYKYKYNYFNNNLINLPFKRYFDGDMTITRPTNRLIFGGIDYNRYDNMQIKTDNDSDGEHIQNLFNTVMSKIDKYIKVYDYNGAPRSITTYTDYNIMNKLEIKKDKNKKKIKENNKIKLFEYPKLNNPAIKYNKYENNNKYKNIKNFKQKIKKWK